MTNNFIHTIPKNVDYVIVADAFVEDYPTGGAELTTEAFLHCCPFPNKRYLKVNSSCVTEDMISKNRDKYWIFGNATMMSHNSWVELIQQEVKYSLFEYDFKYCTYRSKHLHERIEKKPCNCHNEERGKVWFQIMKHAQHVFFMSHKQCAEYRKLFSGMSKWNTIHAFGSMWSQDSLELLFSLYEKRQQTGNNDKFVVLGGGSWIKNQQQTETYLKQQNISYDVIGGLPWSSFVEKMSEYKGLCFMPQGFDTDPRIVKEADMMGLELILNENALGDIFKSDHKQSQKTYYEGIPERCWHILSK